MRPRVLLLILLTLPGCDDPQQRALTALTHDGYTLSVAEFHRAAENGDVNALESFLRAGISIDVPGKDGETALIHAVRGKQSAAAEFLAQKGARLATRDLRQDTTLLLATRSGDPKLVTLLLPAHQPAQIESAFVEAARSGQTEALKSFLASSQGAAARALALSASALDSALLAAAEKENIECLDLLLQAGADPDARQKHTGCTPLHFAVQHGRHAAAQLLLRNGASRLALTRDAKSVWDLAPLSAYLAKILSTPESAPARPPSIAGAGIQGSLSLIDTHLTPLSLMFTRIEDRAAILRRTTTNQELHVRPGEIISDTVWRLDAVVTESRTIPAWALPHLILTDTLTQQPHLVIKDRPALVPPISATVQINGTDAVYEACAGDTFVLADKRHTISSITRNQLVMQDMAGMSKTLLLAK